MGKTDFNGLSQWTGRIGGLVFKVVNGKQVIMPYKKEVFNPRTGAQMSHRARLALASSINKIVPKEVLVGLSPDRRSRRPLFTSNIVRHANVSVAGGVVKATLNAHDLVFSQGVDAPVSVSGVTVTDGLVGGGDSRPPNVARATAVVGGGACRGVRHPSRHAGHRERQCGASIRGADVAHLDGSQSHRRFRRGGALVGRRLHVHDDDAFGRGELPVRALAVSDQCCDWVRLFGAVVGPHCMAALHHTAL